MGHANPMWFGIPWSEQCRPHDRVATPCGLRCTHCKEEVQPGDSGVLVEMGEAELPKPLHLPCLVWLTAGPVNHQRQLCAHFGGTLPGDPPSLSKREAAQVAYMHFLRELRRRNGTALQIDRGELEP